MHSYRCYAICSSTFFIILLFFFFFFNDTATTEIYTLSLHDALPIYKRTSRLTGFQVAVRRESQPIRGERVATRGDRKSTRLNSSHSQISYAVFCLKKKKKKEEYTPSVQKSIYETQAPAAQVIRCIVN